MERFLQAENFAEGVYEFTQREAEGVKGRRLVLWNLFVKLIRRRASNWYIVISRLFKQQVVAVIGKSFACTRTDTIAFEV